MLFALPGCVTLGPDYKRPVLPESDVPTQWTSPADTAKNTTAQKAQWWSELSDPALNRLVAEAFNNSPTLEAAVAKLNQSRSLHAQAKADGGPTVKGTGGAERQVDDSSGTPYNDSWLSMNSSWELDLFGSVRRGKEGALAREEVQQASLADARVSLAADVADAYLNHRACQSHLSLSEQDVASREATEKLTAASVDSGFTAPYLGIRSKASVADAKTSLASTRAQCQQLENLLTRLTGITHPTLMTVLAEKPTGLDRLPEPKHFTVAIPSQALLQRPDIRAAERRLAAASADIGVAEADRYPRISLSGALGYSATGTSSGGILSFGTWSFGPSVSLPIFDGGRRKAEVEIAKARYEESLASFKSKTRSAIQEVEDALTSYAATHERAQNALTAADQYKQFFATVENRYREGASNLLELEDARRSMLDAQQTLLSVQKERLQAWIALNRATGGGAQYAPDTAAKPQLSATTTSPQ
ncbi:efflux transporter outer membrane subunit [Uliginosibacterium gangwonense]|uniref:efflux transporter outer membrane subunit n=1 Tax=Uliginosibacterium gangwonense TaxID=392736 RepID=UPI000380C1A8|nr:efflux transporter outer membrane subunit [Uliginosibacterium gangwonense]